MASDLPYQFQPESQPFGSVSKWMDMTPGVGTQCVRLAAVCVRHCFSLLDYKGLFWFYWTINPLQTGLIFSDWINAFFYCRELSYELSDPYPPSVGLTVR